MEILERYTFLDSILPTETGVYCIFNRLNGNKYIGSARGQGKYPSTRGFRSRFFHHRNDLRLNKHHSKYLQNSYNHYVHELGLNPNDVFEIHILVYVERDKCLEVEQNYLDIYNPDYNSNPLAAGGGIKGFKPSPEHVAKLAAAAKRPKSAEHRRKLSEANKGKTLPPEQREKISAATKGKPKSQEMRERLSATRTGMKRAPFTAEHLANMSAARKGKKKSPETIARMSEAAKARWARQKEREAS
jgi:group I intron endonuclease